MIKLKYTLFSFGVFLLSFVAMTPVMAIISASSSSLAYMLPSKLEGVRQPVLSLSGTWDFKYSPKSRWATIKVPGEAAMQGFAIEHDKPFTYRKKFTVPADYNGKRIILRFDGVYSHARLSINGKFIREHHGGFTRWETDVTDWVRVGKKNEIQVEVTDRLDEISYAAGYAHHPIGGILRDVTLFALPHSHVSDVSIETHLDSLYKDADLRLSCHFSGLKDAELELKLKAADGKQVSLLHNRFPLTNGENVFSLPVKNPLKWDAEHPNLYTLEITLYQNKKELSRFHRNIGFRDVKISGNKMLVNGRSVKLRGACRHDIHPKLGRTTTAELDSLDVILFKQSNMNFVRTSHYPPTERFLEYCDRYGVYVESETAVCFVNTYRQKNYAPGKTQSDPAYADRYLGQCQEMVKSSRSHPSILFWSIGNESVYGSNFQLCWDWIKKTDTTRPVIFSYPGSVDKKEKIYDILSMHYQDVYGNLSQWGMTTRNFQGHGIPALFDEWAHPACYTYNTLQTDPNIREFWGKSLDMMWSGLFDSPGGLGGAIWGYVDETFALPEPQMGTSFWKEFAHTAKPKDYQGNCVGYGEWGIVDVWRRKKPEFWSTKKAYSPVRLLTEDNIMFTPGQRLTLTVYNRFDHTYLNEIQASYTYKGIKKTVKLPAIEPHQKGTMTIPGEQWEVGEPILIEFATSSGNLIDAYRLILGEEKINYPTTTAGKILSVKDNGTFITVSGEGFEIPFDKSTGLIVNAKAGDKIIIEKGPFLNLYVNLNHLSGAEVRKSANYFATSDADWQKTSLTYNQQKEVVYIDLSGTYKDIKVDFNIKITPDGQLDMNYLTSGVPNGFLRETGLSFYVSDAVQYLDWKRKGYWNYYPEGEFAGNEGHTSLYNDYHPAYGERPVQPWQTDTHNYYYWADAGTNCKQPLTQTAKGMKENIHYYTLSLATSGGHQLSVVSRDASVACRMNKRTNEQLVLYTNNRWDYPEIAWGNYCKKLEAIPCYGQINLRIK
ncbi:MAG: beta-galactosidase [Bacteroides caccae]|nr:beta-galactosidase [Bacteroides caccae]